MALNFLAGGDTINNNQSYSSSSNTSNSYSYQYSPTSSNTQSLILNLGSPNSSINPSINPVVAPALSQSTTPVASSSQGTGQSASTDEMSKYVLLGGLVLGAIVLIK